MRFVLDHDVDVTLCELIRSKGHDCWRAPDYLARDGRDDEISIYADDKGAVVVSHDAAFAARRRRHPIGIHVRLRCSEPDAIDVFAAYLPELLAAMYMDQCVINISKEGVVVIPPGV